MKNVLKYILTFVLMVIMALGLLLASSCIPRVFLRNNVRISANELKRENEKFIVRSFDKRLLFHNSTDAIMINITYGIDENDKLESVIKARRNYIPGIKQDIVEDKNGNFKGLSEVGVKGYDPNAKIYYEDEPDSNLWQLVDFNK